MSPFKVLSTLTLMALALFPRAHGQENYSRAGIFNVREYGALGDGTTIDTAAIQKTFRACADAGGGTVIFPPGKYISGTLELFSNTTIKLAPGAIIQASANLQDYRAGKDFGLARDYGTNLSGEGTLAGLLVAHDVENVSIIGRGTIDGRGDDFMDFSEPHVSADFDPQYTRQGAAFRSASASLEYGPVEPKAHGAGRPGTLILFFHVKNVLIRDITIQNAPNWTLHLQSVSIGNIDGVHILNNPTIPNNDGIDCMDCHDVHISNCDIRTGDDDFAIVGSEDINVSNCSLQSRSAAIRLESTRRATFQGLTINTNRGIAIFHREGAQTDSVLFSDILMRTRLIPGHWWGKAEPIYIAVSPCHAKTCSGVSNVRFTNIEAEAEAGALIVGDSASPVTGLVMDNVRIRMHSPAHEIASAVGGNFDLRWTATSLKDAIFRHDIPAFYCRHVNNLTLRSVDVDWPATFPDYFSNSLECEDFSNLRLDGFWETRVTRSEHPSISLRHGATVTIRNSSARPRAKKFLLLKDVTGVDGEGSWAPSSRKEPQ